MKKVTLSMAAVSILATTSSFAADDLASAFKEGKASGQIRAFYITRDYDSRNETATNKDRYGFAIGGKLGYETAALYGVSAGATFYTTNGLGLKNSDNLKVNESIYGTGTNRPVTTYLGEAYLQGTFGKTYR